MIFEYVTDYVITGDDKELNYLFSVIEKLTHCDKPARANKYSSNWVGYLLAGIGEDVEEYICDGEFELYCLENGELRFRIYTMHGVMVGVHSILCRHFPSIKIYWSSENDWKGFFATNDSEFLYFDRYVIHKDGQQEYVVTDDDLLYYFSYNSPKSFKSIEELDKYIEKNIECDWEYHKFMIVKDEYGKKIPDDI